ncbi:MAG: phosphate signaling complex protein PhoU [Lachnospiraceae bacterium]|jgi:phosphate transport system protein|nr:phosphate signaling complex protein PhoU [Lachnospiraceae bacterium]
MSPRSNFLKELDQLSQSLREMTNSVEETYAALFAALEQRNEEEIIRIAASQKTFGNMQRTIESQCLSLIIRQQPIAGDLRVVTATLKMVTDIDRIGDHVADMAESLLRLKMIDLSVYSSKLSEMIRSAGDMLHNAIDAFFNRDADAAKKVIASDDLVDDLFNMVKDDIITLLRNESKDVDECIDILMIAKYLEKIGDHAENIGEWEIFRETGNIDDIRLL